MAIIDPAELNTLVEEAPEEGFNPVNFGKLSVEAGALSWEDRQPVRREFTGGALRSGETLELTFTVDIREMNPQLEFQYERTVAVRKSSARSKTDWEEIVLPSLVETFGADWAKKVQSGLYVQVEDVPNIKGKTSKTSGNVWGVPKFIGQYADLPACVAARGERFGGSRTSSAPAASPSANGSIPAAAIEQAAGLLASIGDEEQVLSMLQGQPFGAHDAKALLDLAKSHNG